MTMPIASEKETQKAILEYLKLKGYFCWRNNTGANVSEYKGKKRFFQYGKVGSGDILGLTKAGGFFSIEVKSSGKKPSPSQLEFMASVINSKGIAILAYSLDDVISAGL